MSIFAEVEKAGLQAYNTRKKGTAGKKKVGVKTYRAKEEDFVQYKKGSERNISHSSYLFPKCLKLYILFPCNKSGEGSLLEALSLLIYL